KHDKPRSLLKHRVAVAHVKLTGSAFAIFIDILRQQESRGIAPLVTDEVGNFLHFRSVYKSALYPYQVASRSKQHVSPADQLVGTSGVEDGPRIYFGEYPESQTGREIGLNGAGDDIYRWTLRSNDQVDAYGTCQLCQAGDRRFHFFSGGHHEVCEFVDNK